MTDVSFNIYALNAVTKAFHFRRCAKLNKHEPSFHAVHNITYVKGKEIKYGNVFYEFRTTKSVSRMLVRKIVLWKIHCLVSSVDISR